MTESLTPFYPSVDINLEIQPGYPAVHEAYRVLRDQKDMVCGAYALTYLLQAYGITSVNGERTTVDLVAAEAGTGLEPHNTERLNNVRSRIENGTIPHERAETWFPHDFFSEDLPAVDEHGGTSPRGVIEACSTVSDGLLTAIPVPAVYENKTQLTEDRFSSLLDGFFDEKITTQPILNYNLGSTLAPASLLGHKYNFTALLTQWDDPSYFRRLDWDVGHFTTVAGRLRRKSSDDRYLLIRDSYKSFGWQGYHLQPESFIREGIVRADDHRDGGILLVSPTSETDACEAWLSEIGLETGLWDNGSEYRGDVDGQV